MLLGQAFYPPNLLLHLQYHIAIQTLMASRWHTFYDALFCFVWANRHPYFNTLAHTLLTVSSPIALQHHRLSTPSCPCNFSINYTIMDTATLASRDDIMKQIACQAASVRCTFEAHPSKRKHDVSSAAAAHKRKFENHLAVRNEGQCGAGPPPAPLGDFFWNKTTSHTFHSHIASFTRPEKVRTVSNGSVIVAPVCPAPVPTPRPPVGSASANFASGWIRVLCKRELAKKNLLVELNLWAALFILRALCAACLLTASTFRAVGMIASCVVYNYYYFYQLHFVLNIVLTQRCSLWKLSCMYSLSIFSSIFQELYWAAHF